MKKKFWRLSSRLVIQNVKLDGGVTIASTDVRASIKEEDRETAYEAFKPGLRRLGEGNHPPRTLESW